MHPLERRSSVTEMETIWTGVKVKEKKKKEKTKSSEKSNTSTHVCITFDPITVEHEEYGEVAMKCSFSVSLYLCVLISLLKKSKENQVHVSGPCTN